MGAEKPDSAVAVRVLDGFALSVDGDAVEVGRRQVRLLATLLAVRSGRPMRPEVLIDQLWGDRLPKDPPASLRVALSRLRALHPGVAAALVNDTNGYDLRCASDVDAFRAALGRAAHSEDPTVRIAERRAALRLFPSEPADELRSLALLDADVALLIEERRNAVERLCADLSDRGDHASLLELARPAVEDDPGWEALAILMVGALIATGRRTDALTALSDTERELRTGYGVEPSAAFRAMEQQALHADVDVSAAPSRPVGGHTAFVGRTAELEELRSRPRHGHVVVIGEPGSGKSVLLDQLVSPTSTDNRLAARATCTPNPQHAMEAVVGVLRALTETRPGAVGDPGVQAVLGRLAPDLVPDGTVAAPQSRDALISQAIEVIERQLPADDAAILIDDCQWLDRGSAAVVAELVAAKRCDLVLATRPQVAAHAAFLLDDPRGQHVELAGLSHHDVAALAAEEGLHASSDMIAEVAQRSGGNALFVRLLLDLVAEGQAASGELPTSVLLAVQQRVGQLAPVTREALEVASVFTDTIDIDLLDRLSPGLGAALLSAITAGLLVQLDHNRVRFTHALVAEATYQLLAPGRRVQLHDELGRLIEEDGGSAAHWAVHAGEAADFDPLRAVRGHVDAAAEFASSFSWDTVLLHLDLAARHRSAHGVREIETDARAGLLRGMAAQALGLADGDELLLEATRQATAADLMTLADRGLLALCSHGRLAQPDDPVGTTVLQMVEQRLEDPALASATRADLCAAGSTLLNGSTEAARGIALYRRAFDLVRDSHDPDLLTRVLMRLDLGLANPHDFQMRQAGIERLASIAGEDPDLLWEVAYLRFGTAQVLGVHDDVEAQLDRMRSLTPRVRLRNRDFGMAFCEAAAARFVGDHERAEALVGDASIVGRTRYSDTWVDNVCGVLTIGIRQGQGRLGELLPMADFGLSLKPTQPYWHGLAAAAAAARGDDARARIEIDALSVANFESLVPDLGYTAKLAMLAEPIALLGDRPAASAVLAKLAPFAGRMVFNGVCVHRPVDVAVAVLEGV